ncbi:MAG TPA: methionyl-tRNA formyltransferase, partial [Chloroflexota bacterium]|nr:methionyl-tRNA formyltransferase [Chloroflexota bacterium]
QIELAGLRPDVLVVASYGQILPRSVLDMPARGALNLHPSLLPRMRGPSPIIVTILEGLQESGVTLMYMTARMDAGPIISQLDVYVPGDATGGWLTGFMAERSADLLMRDLPAWLEGKLEPRAQDEEDATYTKLIKKTDGDIDWRMEAADIERRVRAYNPWPWAYTWFGGRQLRIMRAEVVPGEAERGRVRIAADGGVEVGTARDVLRLLEVQLEGRRPVDGRSFVLGYPGVNGVVLGNGA